ncbi:pectin lyase fold/virulence factor [Crucibulum laeve]|uniref:pectin lyase n=1 Tax=Crucibulum laeve TaxID=68775 RepID=A0A5C3M421_9AGAR|nr:pectin lyase fold/virulence factor [Crucibulum laeve]
MALQIAALLTSIALLPTFVFSVGTPFGLATGTTGGGNASPQTPSSITELATWLSDGTARVIVLDKIYDFTGSEGTVTGSACAPWTCTPNPQLAINANSWCDNYEPSASKTTVTYDKAGTTPLKVASNKTLLGKGSSGGLRGKGLKITGANNIIIQNIKISEIQAQTQDAIQIDGGNNIWIDHNTIQAIGRQMVVTGYGAVTKTTISNNVFNGDGTYSATCNGEHYWVALFTGAGDQITFALNYLYRTSGRGPHVGTSGYYQNVHIYNNYFVSVGGHAVDPEVGSKVLIEGNYFNTVTTPILQGDGQAFAPVTSAQTAQCSSLLGRSCVANTAISSGALPGTGTDAGTLNGFTASTYKSASIMAASQVGSYVQSNAGVGKVN